MLITPEVLRCSQGRTRLIVNLNQPRSTTRTKGNDLFVTIGVRAMPAFGKACKGKSAEPTQKMPQTVSTVLKGTVSGKN